MKNIALWVVVALLAAPFALVAQDDAMTEAPAAPGGFDSLEQAASYAIGMNMAMGMKQQNVPIDVDIFIQGLRDALGDGETRLSQDEMGQTLQQFQQMMMARQQEARDQQGQENLQKAEQFFAENKDEEGVVTTDSGLQYKVLEAGEGDPPSLDDRVTVHYRGTLLDGTQFDSSYERNQPATFPVNGVIQGWQEALQLMAPGSKYMLWIPPALAYGAQGQGPVIGPNETLVFEVELLEIAEDEGAGTGSAGAEGGR